MFINRKDAAVKLASLLRKFRRNNPLVLGIPKGGAETAMHIARHLQAEMSLLVVHKLMFPLHPEVAFGAVAEDGSEYCSELGKQSLTADVRKSIVEQVRNGVAADVEFYRHGQPLPDMEGRFVLLVDDGIVTGATIRAAVEMCVKAKPAHLVVASPLASNRMDAILRQRVDELVILEKTSLPADLSQGYLDFLPVSRQQVAAYLAGWEREFPLQHAS